MLSSSVKLGRLSLNLGESEEITDQKLLQGDTLYLFQNTLAQIAENVERNSSSSPRVVKTTKVVNLLVSLGSVIKKRVRLSCSFRE